MTDEPVKEQPNNEDSEQSASAIFVELMRQAAAKASPKPAKAESAEADGASGEWRQAERALNGDGEPSLEPKSEEHQIRRVRRRLVLRRPHPSSMASGFLGTIFVVVVSTALVATLLMFFVNPEFLNPAVVQGLLPPQ